MESNNPKWLSHTRYQNTARIVYYVLVSYPRALLDVFDDLDANIVSEEGEVVLGDSEKMQKVDEAIEKYNREERTGPLIVKY